MLQIEHLYKRKRGHEILKDISFEVKEQEIVGFLGSNGSGKTTTLKCVCGLYHMTSGKITIGGYDIEKNKAKALEQIGASIEEPALYPNLTGREHLEMVGRWRGVGKERIKEMEKYSGLGEDRLVKKAGRYSMGMKMRLMLAMTLLVKPKLIILDEPTNGLDPQAIFELRKEMLEIKREGSSILFSSHNLSEVEKLADKVVILDNGVKIYDGIIPQNMHVGVEYQILTANVQEAVQILNGMPVKNITRVGNEGVSFYTLEDNSLSIVLEGFSRNNIEIADITKCDADLEEFYKRLYEEKERMR